jgi:hypothetical protein
VKRPEGDPPESFRQLCCGLHQDALKIAGHDIRRLAANCVDFVPEGRKQELRAYIQKLLAELTPAQLNGVMKRARTDFYFKGEASRVFLEAAADALTRPRPPRP